ncbi:MAG: putative transport system ATP-binding protein [Thermoleophilaceae bacterium]|nr:putative transport system ATP-binding protein [Thermoleophilaceae bacterium]
MTEAAGITLESVAKEYETPGGLVRAVDGIDLRVEPGTSLAIVGPSGCGKSTLLGLIAGLEAPTSGRVVVGEAEVSDLPDDERAGLRRHELGLVFQAGNLLPFLTVLENVSQQLALTGSADGYQRCVDMLGGLGLGDDLDKLPDQLSGGMRQRVAVARALIHEPRLILADEPTGSLDGDNSEVVIDLLLAAKEQEGATLVVVTHDAGVAARLDTTLKLRDGRIDA